jgi:hypothetical protein
MRHEANLDKKDAALVLGCVVFLLTSMGAIGSGGRERAKRAVCLANLKQLALAWNVYLNDNDGYFYQGIRANLDYGGWEGLMAWWPRPLNRYVLAEPNSATEKNARIFCCPSDRGGIPGALVREKAYRVHGTSYQTNVFLIGQDRCGAFSDKTAILDERISERLRRVNRSQVTDPSRLLLMGDYGWVNQWRPMPHPYKEWKDLAEWHSKVDCHSMAFLDGHVGLLRIRKGYYVTSEYWVLPFEDLRELALEVQGPEE